MACAGSRHDLQNSGFVLELNFPTTGATASGSAREGQVIRPETRHSTAALLCCSTYISHGFA
jgi:hypothetical protein